MTDSFPKLLLVMLFYHNRRLRFMGNYWNRPGCNLGQIMELWARKTIACSQLNELLWELRRQSWEHADHEGLLYKTLEGSKDSIGAVGMLFCMTTLWFWSAAAEESTVIIEVISSGKCFLRLIIQKLWPEVVKAIPMLAAKHGNV